MKRIVLFLAAAVLVSACGSVNNKYISNASDEEIDMGYGTVKQKHSTSSARAVSGQYESYTTFYDYLRGKVPGVHVGQAVANGTPQITIRGVSNFSGGYDNQPLVLVDGVEVQDLETIDPKYIRRVTVLKGPDAAIYGNRGANGVILVATKQK